MQERTALKALWIAVAVQIAGRALDFRWHATHDEFEGTIQQLEAHWLLWLGTAALLIVAAAAVRRLPRPNPGWTLTLASAVIYVPVAVWHFIEHANLNDPELAHVLLALTGVGMIAGAILATVLPRRHGLSGSGIA
jgi:hypothetical protein